MSYRLEAYVDGASRGNPGPAGAGAVIRDSAGRERRVVALYLGVRTNNVAEYLALHEALKAALEVCPEDGVEPSAVSLVVHTDSELMARQVSGLYRVKSANLQPLVRTYDELARRFQEVRVVHVPRERNGRADALANEAIDGRTRAGAPCGARTGSPAAGPAPFSRLEHFECFTCGERLKPAGEHRACPACGGILLARYDLAGLVWPPAPPPPAPPPPVPQRSAPPRSALSTPAQAPVSRRSPASSVSEPPPTSLSPFLETSMWRYHELLPVTSPEFVVTLGEGLTPLVELSSEHFRCSWPGGGGAGLFPESSSASAAVGAAASASASRARASRARASASVGAAGYPRLWVKNEGTNPTGTFKARGASASVSRLVETGFSRCAMPTAGNAGSAFAAYCARAGVEFLTAMPEVTPEAIRRECESYGATVELVPGFLTDAAGHLRARVGETVRAGEPDRPWFWAATFDEPYRLEGKKTIGFELFEAFGGRWPQVIVCPVGGGVALVAIWKAVEELAAAGWASPPPRLLAVQATACSPVVQAFEEGAARCRPFEAVHTIAAGLTVPAPKGGALVLRALRASGGGAVAVPDEAIAAAVSRLRRLDGLDFCPEGAAAAAALPLLAERGLLDGRDEVVIINTGSGLKYPR